MPDALRTYERVWDWIGHGVTILGKRKENTKGLILKEFVRPRDAWFNPKAKKYQDPLVYWDVSKGCYVARQLPYLPERESDGRREAHDYVEACHELDRTPAGKKAMKLLFEFLSEDQIKDYQREFAFWECFPCQNEIGLLWIEFITWSTAGNIRLARSYKGERVEGLCLHPDDPFPTGDILLTQLLHFRRCQRLTEIANTFRVR